MSDLLTVGLKVGSFNYDNIEIDGLNLRYGFVVTKRDYKQARVRTDNPESLRFKVKFEAIEKTSLSCGYLIDWFNAVKKGHPLLVNKDLNQSLKQKISISLKNPSMTFDLDGAFPCGWRLSGLSEGQTPYIEIEFVYEKISQGKNL